MQQNQKPSTHVDDPHHSDQRAAMKAKSPAIRPVEGKSMDPAPVEVAAATALVADWTLEEASDMALLVMIIVWDVWSYVDRDVMNHSPAQSVGSGGRSASCDLS
jgi:hypothetical protein